MKTKTVTLRLPPNYLQQPNRLATRRELAYVAHQLLEHQRDELRRTTLIGFVARCIAAIDVAVRRVLRGRRA